MDYQNSFASSDCVAEKCAEMMLNEREQERMTLLGAVDSSRLSRLLEHVILNDFSNTTRTIYSCRTKPQCNYSSICPSDSESLILDSHPLGPATESTYLRVPVVRLFEFPYRSIFIYMTRTALLALLSSFKSTFTIPILANYESR